METMITYHGDKIPAKRLGRQKCNWGREIYEVLEVNHKEGKYLLVYNGGADHGFFNNLDDVISKLWAVNVYCIPDRLIQKLGGLIEVPSDYEPPKRSFWTYFFGDWEETPEEKKVRQLKDNQRRRRRFLNADLYGRYPI